MRNEFMEALDMLRQLGFQLVATPGTAEYYRNRGFSEIISLEKPGEANEDPGANTVLNWIHSKKIDLVINIPEGTTRHDEVTAGYLMRRAAVDFGVSLLTNIKCAILFAEAMHMGRGLECRSAEDYLATASVGW